MTTPWLATMTRRWHCNSDLSHTVDPVGYHGGRMAVMALEFWGDGASRALLVACVCHDLGEHATGDVPAPAKADKKLAKALRRLEGKALDDLGLAFKLNKRDKRRLQYLDRVDAYKWAQHHAPHILGREEWVAAKEWLYAERERIE